MTTSVSFRLFPLSQGFRRKTLRFDALLKLVTDWSLEQTMGDRKSVV